MAVLAVTVEDEVPRRFVGREPPRLWPIITSGARWCARSHLAAATMSPRLVEKVVYSNAPPLSPIPVKSKRSTATPRSVSARARRTSDLRSLPQV